MATQIERLAGSEIADLLATIQSGERLSASACARLWQTHDLTSLGSLANLEREKRHGNVTRFRPVIHLNYTGRPVPACLLCSQAAGQFELAEWEAALTTLAPEMVAELHVSGGPGAGRSVTELCQLVRRVHELRPRLRIRGFTWSELEQAAAKDRMAPLEVLQHLAEAGLHSLLGGALSDLTPARPHLSSDSIPEIESRRPWIEAAAQLGL